MILTNTQCKNVKAITKPMKLSDGGGIFPHELWHEGSPVISGKKYVLRFDVMYRKGQE